MSQAFIRFQLRRGFANEWTGTNPVLAEGEVGLETDTGRFKVGDGQTRWRLLPYGGEQGEQGSQGEPGLMIGQLALTPWAMSLPGTLPANGIQLTSALHPELAQMLGYGNDLPVEEVMGLPAIPSATFASTSGSFACAASPDGLIAVATNRAQTIVLDTNDWSQVSIPDTPVFTSTRNSVAFSPDGVYLAFSTNASSGRQTVWLLDRATNTYIDIPEIIAFARHLCFTSDSRYLAMIVTGRLWVIDLLNMSLVDLPDSLDIEFTYQVATSKAGTTIALLHRLDKQLTIVDTSDWSVVSGSPSIPGSTSWSSFTANGALAFSDDGAWLAVTYRGLQTLRVFDTQTWEAVSPELTLPGNPISIAFSPDANILAVTHAGEPYIVAFDTSSWTEHGPLPFLPYGPRDEGLAFTPDGFHLVVARIKPIGSDDQGYSVFSTGVADTFTLPDVSSDDPRMVWRIKNQESN